jgi:hypothetical protein
MSSNNLGFFSSVRQFFNNDDSKYQNAYSELPGYSVNDKVIYTNNLGFKMTMVVLETKMNLDGVKVYKLQDIKSKIICEIPVGSKMLSDYVAPLNISDAHHGAKITSNSTLTPLTPMSYAPPPIKTKYKKGDRCSLSHNNCRFLSDIKEVRIKDGKISYLVAPCGYTQNHEKWLDEGDYRLTDAHFNNTWNQERINRDHERRLDKEMRNKHKCMCDPNYECMCSRTDGYVRSNTPLVPLTYNAVKLSNIPTSIQTNITPQKIITKPFFIKPLTNNNATMDNILPPLTTSNNTVDAKMHELDNLLNTNQFIVNTTVQPLGIIDDVFKKHEPLLPLVVEPVGTTENIQQVNPIAEPIVEDITGDIVDDNHNRKLLLTQIELVKSAIREAEEKYQNDFRVIHDTLNNSSDTSELLQMNIQLDADKLDRFEEDVKLYKSAEEVINKSNEKSIKRLACDLRWFINVYSNITGLSQEETQNYNETFSKYFASGITTNSPETNPVEHDINLQFSSLEQPK